MNWSEKRYLKQRKEYLQQKRRAKQLRREVEEQRQYYSRYDKPIKSRYTHFIAGDDFKRITKGNRVFNVRRNQVTHIQ